jgi:hypothetical protein
MIFVRHYDARDAVAVKELYIAQGADYELPDFEQPQFVVRTVIEEDSIVTHALFLRKTAEAYWLFNPRTASRVNTIGRMFMLQKEVVPLAKQAGFTDVHAWLPPAIAERKAFDKMLIEKFRWERMLWPVYRKPL